MTSPAKRKGGQFERDVVTFFREHGHRYVERAYGSGRPLDVGDIDGIAGVIIECKNHAAPRPGRMVSAKPAPRPPTPAVHAGP